jgi:phosphatidylserine decarboxylase
VRIAREGIPFALASILLAGTCWGIVWVLGDSRLSGGTTATEVVLQIVGGVTSLIAIFILYFFRDPEPNIPYDESLVVAPGQGKVILIEDVDQVDFISGAAKKISIFLSVFDVHVQRAPVSGTVGHKVYRQGAYTVAWAEKSSEDNEQSSLGIVTEHGRILVRQIAGLVARRIVTDPSLGDSVERGNRFGIIRFGSRVDLFLPPHWEILCAEGDRVKVGSSPIARMRPEKL